MILAIRSSKDLFLHWSKEEEEGRKKRRKVEAKKKEKKRERRAGKAKYSGRKEGWLNAIHINIH